MKGAAQILISTLPERSREVLKWVVREYTDSGIPVASTHLVDLDRFNVGSATLRSELNALETDGYLLQPHTSAGRVPTESGYRYFVDHLMRPLDATLSVNHQFDRNLERFAADIDALIQYTTRFLGEMAQAMVFMSPPRPRGLRIEGISLHDVDAQTILLLVSLSQGQSKTFAIHLGSSMSRSLLKEAEQILNDQFQGMDLKAFEADFDTSSQDLQRGRPRSFQRILKGLRQAIHEDVDREYMVYGSHQLLHYPELAPAEIFEPILASLEDGRLKEQLPAGTGSHSLQIRIGRELGEEFLNPLSCISLQYSAGRIGGMIHILGPTRMSYEKVVGLLSRVSDILNKSIRGSHHT